MHHKPRGRFHATLHETTLILSLPFLTRGVPEDEVHLAAVDLERGLALVEARRDVLLKETQRERGI